MKARRTSSTLDIFSWLVQAVETVLKETSRVAIKGRGLAQSKFEGFSAGPRDPDGDRGRVLRGPSSTHYSPHYLGDTGWRYPKFLDCDWTLVQVTDSG